MRRDMAKVIVERPRLGCRQKQRKGYWKEWRTLAPEDWSKRERISEHKGGTKGFNEHLGPLRRYLRKQVGRPWNKVFSEICEHLRLDSAVQSHVRDHLDDYVATSVIEINGVACFGNGRLIGRPIARQRWTFLYVCPRTGLLRLVKHKLAKAPIHRICESETRQYHRIDNVWFEVRLCKIPHDISTCWDAVLDKPLVRCGRGELTARYGFAAYALSKRALKSAETRKLLKSKKTGIGNRKSGFGGSAQAPAAP